MIVILTQVSGKRKTTDPARLVSQNSPGAAVSPRFTFQSPRPTATPQDPKPPCVTMGFCNKLCYIPTLPSTQSPTSFRRVTGQTRTVSSHSAQRGGCVTMLGGAA
jgi:hypothetical protein